VSELPQLTAPQLAALLWLIEKAGDGRGVFVGSMFEVYYGDRWRREVAAEQGRVPPGWAPTLGHKRAWWRTGGAMLRRLKEKGVLREQWDWPRRSYAPTYELTDLAYDVARAARMG
jgi:hypothetical protein